MRRSASLVLRRVVVPVSVVGALLLSGCTAFAGGTPTSPVASTSASPAPTAATLIPDGTAAENLPVFTAAMNQVAATDARFQGRAYIDALVAVGFPKAQMEVTNDLTTVGNPADSIQFSVRWAGECVVGQVGPSTPTPTAVVLPLLPGGTCLLGQTRPIDW